MLPVIGDPTAWLLYFLIGIAVSIALTIALKAFGPSKKAVVETA